MNVRTIVWTAVLVSQVGVGSLVVATAHAANTAANGHAADAEHEARAAFARGDTAFKNGKYAQAVTEFEAGYALSPRSGFILNIGHAWRKLGNLHKARAYYKRYLLIEPESRFRQSVVAVIAELDAALAEEGPAAADNPSSTTTRTSPGPASPTKTAPPPPALNAREPVARTPAVNLITSPSSPSAALPSSTPGSGPAIYRRPWFWVAVGVVLAGAGVGIYMAKRSGGQEFHAAGGLGSVGP